MIIYYKYLFRPPDIATKLSPGTLLFPSRLGSLVAVVHLLLSTSALGQVETQTSTISSKGVEQIIVTSKPNEGLRDSFRPTTSLGAVKLQEELQASVPETIANLPGVAVAYNGPGAARPTIRGLAGDRVLMLEDGFLTGDLYWSASDHGVMVEPLTAHRIDVVRGPASLIYSGNALGGVVNVVRGDVPRSQPTRWTASFGTQADSASTGIAQGGEVVVPLGPFTIRAEESLRQLNDVRTPLGELVNTRLESLGGSLGVGWHPKWGHAGVSVRYYENTYGVPGQFNGQLIPGGHPGGATIEVHRLSAKFDLEASIDQISWLDSIKLGGSFTQYSHDEVEGFIAGDRAVGALFDLSTGQVSLNVQPADAELGQHTKLSGELGLILTYQDLLAQGNSPGVRSGDQLGLGAFFV